MSSTSVASDPIPAGKPRLSAVQWVLAGHEVLISDGAEAIKIDGIAAYLGVTKGSFYWHFKSLAAFQEAMIERFIEDGKLRMQGFERTAPAEPRERLLYLMNQVSDPHFSELERAMRSWINMGDDLEIHLSELDAWGYGVVLSAFEQLGFAGRDAEVRAKALYYAGIGRIHTRTLGEPETLEHREALLDIPARR